MASRRGGHFFYFLAETVSVEATYKGLKKNDPIYRSIYLCTIIGRSTTRREVTFAVSLSFQ